MGWSQPYLPRKDEPKSRKTEAPRKTGFLGLLNTAEEPRATVEAGDVRTESDLETLLDNVYEAGQELAQNPSPEHVLTYKRMVAQFVRRVVDGALELAETEGRVRKDLKKPKYAVLRVIDEKLDKLGAYVLSQQRDKLELLRKVDELHGLLVDLRH